MSTWRRTVRRTDADVAWPKMTAEPLRRLGQEILGRQVDLRRGRALRFGHIDCRVGQMSWIRCLPHPSVLERRLGSPNK
jgi:hypothetical protein